MGWCVGSKPEDVKLLCNIKYLYGSMAVPEGVEPPTFGLGNRCSIRLSYGADRAITGHGSRARSSTRLLDGDRPCDVAPPAVPGLAAFGLYPARRT